MPSNLTKVYWVICFTCHNAFLDSLIHEGYIRCCLCIWLKRGVLEDFAPYGSGQSLHQKCAFSMNSTSCLLLAGQLFSVGSSLNHVNVYVVPCCALLAMPFHFRPSCCLTVRLPFLSCIFFKWLPFSLKS